MSAPPSALDLAPDASDFRALRVGVLALQGDFQAHIQLVTQLGAAACPVRRPAALDELDALILPGGESTTLLKHFEFDPSWWEALACFAASGRVLFGTCAGLILLAREVRGPSQRSLGLLDCVVERNSYGRQIESFEESGRWVDGRPLSMVFIRAPRIIERGAEVEVLAEFRGDPVVVRQGQVFAASFHPEINGEPSLHAEVLRACVRPAATP